MRWIPFGINTLLIMWLISGCAATKIQTAGLTPTLQWRATDFRHYMVELENRQIYRYSLVLEDTQGQAITFTHLSAYIWNSPQSRQVTWQRSGTWVLPAHGTIDIPLGSYRYCLAINCKEWGSFTPIWHLTLSGTTAQGDPIREVIKMHLPYVPHAA